MAAFVDTNVFIHYLLAYDPPKFASCLQLMRAAEFGDVELETSEMVFAELIWFLARPPFRMKPGEIRDRLIPLTTLPGLRLPNGEMVRQALDEHVDVGVNYVDAYNSVHMRRRGIDRIYSYDTDFDRVPGVTRAEP